MAKESKPQQPKGPPAVRPFHEKFAAKTDHAGKPLPGEAERVAREEAAERAGIDRP